MSDPVLEVAERLWTGDASMRDVNPFFIGGDLAEVAPGTAFVPSFANAAVFLTDDGLVMVDTGSRFQADAVNKQVRAWRPDAPLHTAVFTHGHVDHVFGVPIYEEEARTNKWVAPTVVAHEAVPHRFDRYRETAGYNGIINQRQFQAPNFRWPVDYRYPDVTYETSMTVEVGGESFELHHGRGETDDATWVYAPARKVLACGDFFIWASPNAGNPQKVQRFAKDWADALRAMVATGAEVLLPGHGVPIVGRDRVVQALSDSAELLDFLHDETLRMMNEGASLDEIVHTVRAPSHLLERPYLRPVYDEPEFVVRNVYRLYGGWWDGDPSQLKPPPRAAFAAEMVALSGGVDAVAKRAVALAEAGDDASLRLAGQLAQLAVDAEPESKVAHNARAEVYERRVAAEASTMSKGVFSWTAKESRDKLEL
jgi:alkyl sulfatase BDS1-like metallo-beta-lactamase superfamily hydrolase